MNERYFIGMDIINEVKAMSNLTIMTCTEGMTDIELDAYKLGIKNTISALKALLDENDMPVVNISGLDVATELTIDELEEYCGSIY